MKKNEFRCYKCKGIFKKELSEKEKIEQLNKEFPGFKPSDCETICDDCYKEMFGE
jgi:hypothetical protein